MEPYIPEGNNSFNEGINKSAGVTEGGACAGMATGDDPDTS